MKYFDPLQGRKLTELIANAAHAASANGTGIDVTGYEGKLAIIQNAGVVSGGEGSTKTAIVKLQHSPDGVTAPADSYVDIENGAFTQITDAAGNGVKVIELDTQKTDAFVRAVVTLGEGATVPLSVMMVGVPRYSE